MSHVESYGMVLEDGPPPRLREMRESLAMKSDTVAE